MSVSHTHVCVCQLVGPLETVHQVKARLDCRGGKTDLALKQGEDLDIIRVQGNPEGRWLGRNQEGASESRSRLEAGSQDLGSEGFLLLLLLPVGYVKISSVEIDFDALKSSVQQTAEPELYDDVGNDVRYQNRWSQE